METKNEERIKEYLRTMEPGDIRNVSNIGKALKISHVMVKYYVMMLIQRGDVDAKMQKVGGAWIISRTQ